MHSFISRRLPPTIDAIEKTQPEARECSIWSVKQHVRGVPIFVQMLSATEEDDGPLFIVVPNGATGTGYLLCLNVRGLSEIARADVPLPLSVLRDTSA